jgi:hypothetical protein
MAKIVFYVPYALSPTIWGTSLEVIQRLLDEGNEVVFIGCDAELEACAYNRGKHPVICDRCTRQRKAGLRALDGDKVSFHRLTRLSDGDRDELAGLQLRHPDVHALKRYCFQGYDLGMAVASTLISALRDHQPDVSGTYADLVARLLQGSARIYLSLQNHLRELAPDAVYTFNGRLEGTRPVLRVAEQLAIPYYVCETGAGPYRFDVFENMIPHDMDRIQDRILAHWARSDPEERVATAHAFYRNKRGGDVARVNCYSAGQQTNRLPEGFDPARRNIVFFNSSDDEFAAVDTGKTEGLFSNQLDAVQTLISLCEQLGQEVTLYLRMHPNLATASVNARQMWLDLASPVLRVIPPDSPVDSYALLEHADLVVTFASTLALDANYWDKPAILLGRSYYSRMGAVYTPENVEELRQLLADPELGPLPKQGALEYAYYWLTRGQPYTYYEYLSRSEGRFKGVRFRAQLSMAERLRYLLWPSSMLWSLKRRLLPRYRGQRLK